MPIKAKLSKQNISASEESEVHFIPASIDGNGAIKIDEYFNSYMENVANDRKLLIIQIWIAYSSEALLEFQF